MEKPTYKTCETKQIRLSERKKGVVPMLHMLPML